MKAYDLHLHSSASDGQYTPSQLMRMSAAAGMDVVALTDHDTTEGLAEAINCIEEECLPLTCVPGIELSTLWRQHEIHIVGLWMDTADLKWQGFLHRQQCQRRIRIQSTFDKLIELRVVSATAAGQAQACLSRRMIADYLVSLACVDHRQRAFTTWLGKGGPAYIVPQWCSLEEALQQIRCAGGLSILAHPLRYGLTGLELTELFETFQNSGGLGVEIPIGKTTRGVLDQLLMLIQRFGLAISTGSDFHDTKARRSIQRLPCAPSSCTPIWELLAWKCATMHHANRSSVK